jgi:hypothetical protein
MLVGRIAIPMRSPGEILVALHALTMVNRVQIRAGKVPPIYESGVRYSRESPGQEQWQTAEQVFRRGSGDCEDLAAWRAAELQEAGELMARPIIRRSRVGWHALVRRASGENEDPSRKLGMR